MSDIFSHDKIKAYIKDGFNVNVEMDEEQMVAIVRTKDNSIKDVVPIHELNLMDDYAKYVSTNFRKSKLEKDIKAYDGIDITPEKMNALYCSIGIASEASEINDMISRNFYFSKPIDRVDLISELSDMCWYKAVFMKLMDIKLVNILKTNIIKLRVRYPDKTTFVQKDEKEEYKKMKEYIDSI